MADVTQIGPADLGDPEVLALLDALTAELAEGGYSAEQTFGYPVEKLVASGVQLVTARTDGALVGIAGVEVQGDGLAELKRFYVAPAARGHGVADALLDRLVRIAADAGVHTLRLETGDRQAAARAFYARRGFVEVERFGPYIGSATSICMQRWL